MSAKQKQREDKAGKAAPAPAKQGGWLWVLVAALVLAGGAWLGARYTGLLASPAATGVVRGDSQAFRIKVQPANVPEGDIVFGNALPDGSYPNVTGRRQILDHGVQRPRSADGPIPFEILARVPVEEWAPNRAVAQPNIDRATPLIMRGSVVSKWAAMGKWSPEFFRRNVPVWKHITRGKRLRRAFINFEYGTPYDECTPWNFWENEDSREEHPMSIDEWFEQASNHTDDYFWAMAEEVPKDLLPDVSPRHTLKLKDQTWVYFSVWMGEGGATTAAHWDMDDNFYVQFYGRKRFLLFSPDTYKSWKSYPRASPNHKQVQMVRDDPSRYAYRLAPGAPLPVAYDATLYPGDMLFLPAYWYHHVEAMLSPPGTTVVNGTPTQDTEHYSISANFWSTSDMDLLVGMSEPLPFDKGTLDGGRFQGDKAAILDAFPKQYPANRIALATRIVLVSMVSAGVWGPGRVAAQARFCSWLRYEDLFGAANAERAASICPPPLSAAHQSAIAASIKSSAEPMIVGLKSLKEHSVREIEFLNYLEMSLIGTTYTKDLYDVIANCYAYTLGQSPVTSTGFLSKYAFDDAQRKKLAHKAEL